MRTYVVLIEQTVDNRFGDSGFVLLGFFEASSPKSARAKAVQECGIIQKSALVAVSSTYWGAA